MSGLYRQLQNQQNEQEIRKEPTKMTKISLQDDTIESIVDAV